MKEKGIIHSIETGGTVDGPGIRFVVFMQGCLMRCLYCHNRDTWDMHTDKSQEVTVDELMQKIISYRFYFRASGGGVTASGGEPLLQAPFIRDLFRACKAYGIHTCLDTNGYARQYNEILDDLMEHTDLVMLDLKQLNPDIHKVLVGVPNTRTLRFAEYLAARGQKTRVRYVIVPGYSDDDDSAHRLGQFIAPMDNIQDVELLPYHELGAHKWELCGDTYQLEGVHPPPRETVERIGGIIRSYGKKTVY